MGTGSANDLGNGGNEKETQLPQVSSPHAISDIRTHEYFDQFPRNSTKSEVPRNFPISEFPQPAPGTRVRGYTYHGTESEIPRYFPPSNSRAPKMTVNLSSSSSEDCPEGSENGNYYTWNSMNWQDDRVPDLSNRRYTSSSSKHEGSSLSKSMKEDQSETIDPEEGRRSQNRTAQRRSRDKKKEPKVRQDRKAENQVEPGEPYKIPESGVMAIKEDLAGRNKVVSKEDELLQKFMSVHITNNNMSSSDVQMGHTRHAAGGVLQSDPQDGQTSFEKKPCDAHLQKDVSEANESATESFPAVKEESKPTDPGCLDDCQNTKDCDNAVLSATATAEMHAVDSFTDVLHRENCHLGIGSWATDRNFLAHSERFVGSLHSELSTLINERSHDSLNQCGNGSNGSGSRVPARRPSAASNKSRQTGGIRKGKRSSVASRDGEIPGDEDNGQDEQEQSGPKKGVGKDLSRRLACPCYASDPEYFSAENFHTGFYIKCATGNGFTDIARVKEHIYRKHFLEFTCPRCKFSFDTQEELDSHIHATPCESRPSVTPKGLTQWMVKDLKSRSKNGRKPTAEETWFDIYRLLSPKSDLPSSPYHIDCEEYIPDVEERETFLQFSERELSGVAARRLDASFWSLELKDFFIQEMLACQKELSEMYRGLQLSESRPHSEDLTASTTIRAGSTQTPSEFTPFSSMRTERTLQSDFDISTSYLSPSQRTQGPFPFTPNFQETPGLDSVTPQVRQVSSSESLNDSTYNFLPRCGKNAFNVGCGTCPDCLGNMKSPTYEPFLGSLPSGSFSTSSVQEYTMDAANQAVDPSIDSVHMDAYLDSQFAKGGPSTQVRSRHTMDPNGESR